jgi:epoxide hydrolase A/B
MHKITHRFVETNGIRMHIAECGTGPLVVMCHGFPESWYSWRHQLPALAEAGFHAVAPDMRGYGQTDRPEPIDQYSLFHLAGDMVGLLDALGAENAAIGGHDWGGPVAWHCALSRPDRFRGVIGLSVPYRPRGPARPSSLMPQNENAFFYQLYFQTPASRKPSSNAMSGIRCEACCTRVLATFRPAAAQAAWFRETADFCRT